MSACTNDQVDRETDSYAQPPSTAVVGGPRVGSGRSSQPTRGYRNGYVTSMVDAPVGLTQLCDVPPAGDELRKLDRQELPSGPSEVIVNGHLKGSTGGHRMSPPLAISGHDRFLPVRVWASRMRKDSPSVTTTVAWCNSRSSRLVAVTCSGRNRPHCSKGQ